VYKKKRGRKSEQNCCSQGKNRHPSSWNVYAVGNRCTTKTSNQFHQQEAWFGNVIFINVANNTALRPLVMLSHLTDDQSIWSMIIHQYLSKSLRTVCRHKPQCKELNYSASFLLHDIHRQQHCGL